LGVTQWTTEMICLGLVVDSNIRPTRKNRNGSDTPKNQETQHSQLIGIDSALITR
jgi:hypothetical protein